ncbi:hypothetical protein GCM10027059_50870 [Myceligenerans halotolerans]
MAGESFYLPDHPNPHATQYGEERRYGEEPSGTIIVHTAENLADLIGEDLGAEAVARFIATRGTFGSYHRVFDADSIVKLAPFGWETWHCRFTNPWSIGLCFAVRADDWHTYPDWYVTAILRNGARAAAEAIRDLKKYWGITVPIEHITGAQARAQQPGFTGHGETDPTRRHDPGDGFPWARFLRMVREELAGDGADPVSNPKPAPKPKPTRSPRRPRTIQRGSTGYLSELWQRILRASGHHLAADGVFGPVSEAETRAWQRARGLVADGVVGPVTWTRALLADADGVLRRGDRGVHVELAQYLIRVRRDRVFGPITEDGTEKVQRFLGITDDGVIGRQSVTALVNHWT